MDENQIAETAGRAYGYIRSYVNDRLEITKLDMIEKSSKVFSGVVTSISIVVIALIFLLFLSVTLALFLGNLLDSYTLAFGIVSMIYLVIGLVVYFFKRSLITNPVLTALIRKMYE